MEELRIRLAALETTVAGQGARFDRLEGHLAKVDEHVAAVQGEVSGITAKLDKVGERIDQLVLQEERRIAVAEATKDQTEAIKAAPLRVDAVERALGDAKKELDAIRKEGLKRETLSDTVLKLAASRGVWMFALLLAGTVVGATMAYRGSLTFADIRPYIPISFNAGGETGPTAVPAPPPPSPDPVPVLAPLQEPDPFEVPGP